MGNEQWHELWFPDLLPSIIISYQFLPLSLDGATQIRRSSDKVGASAVDCRIKNRGTSVCPSREDAHVMSSELVRYRRKYKNVPSNSPENKTLCQNADSVILLAPKFFGGIGLSIGQSLQGSR